MPHILQHMPAEPMLHAGIASARVNAVPMPSASARINICCAAGSAENCCGVFFSFAMIVLLPYSSIFWMGPMPGHGHSARPTFFHLLSEGHALDVFQTPRMAERIVHHVGGRAGLPRFCLDRKIAEIARFSQSGAEISLSHLRWIDAHPRHAERAAGIHIFDAGHCQQHAPDIGDVVVTVHLGEIDRDGFHRLLP